MTRRLLAALTLMTLAGACEPATNQTYPGPALQTLKGTMTAKQGLTVTQPVRLSIAWFKYFAPGAGPVSKPQGFVTSDVAYTGTFPQAYTFDLQTTPPAQAVVTDASGVRGAMGVLLAYEDLNGDGKLTVSAGPGPTPDRVLGASAAVLAHPFAGATPTPTPTSYVLYVEDPPPASVPGATQGYNLVSVDEGGMMKTTSLDAATLDLQLTADPNLSVLACDEFHTALGSGNFAATACGVSLGGDEVRVSAALNKSDTSDFATVTIGSFRADGGYEVDARSQAAVVKVNQRQLEWSDAGAGFFSYDTTGMLLSNGVNTVSVQLPGAPSWDASCVMPNDFVVTAPSTVKVSSSFVVSWSSATPDDSRYFVTPTAQPALKNANDSAEVTAQSVPGSMTVSVIAQPKAVSLAQCGRMHTTTITVTP